MKFNEKETKLLLDLFHIYAPSRGEKNLIHFIDNWLNENQIPHTIDDKGNIFSLRYKGEPLFSSHMDCVGDGEDGWYVQLIDIYPYLGDYILKGIGNVGGDDKCGIFLILLLLAAGKHINFVFSIGEEVGNPDGIKTAVVNMEKENKEIWDSIPYCIVIDRKGNGDIIGKENQYCSKDFDEKLEEIGGEFGYKSVHGGFSDTNTLKEYFNSCNLSAAYYNPHSSTEYVSLNGLYNLLEYLQAILEKMPKEKELRGVYLAAANAAKAKATTPAAPADGAGKAPEKIEPEFELLEPVDMLTIGMDQDGNPIVGEVPDVTLGSLADLDEASFESPTEDDDELNDANEDEKDGLIISDRSNVTVYLSKNQLEGLYREYGLTKEAIKALTVDDVLQYLGDLEAIERAYKEAANS